MLRQDSTDLDKSSVSFSLLAMRKDLQHSSAPKLVSGNVSQDPPPVAVHFSLEHLGTLRRGFACGAGQL